MSSIFWSLVLLGLLQVQVATGFGTGCFIPHQHVGVGIRRDLGTAVLKANNIRLSSYQKRQRRIQSRTWLNNSPESSTSSCTTADVENGDLENGNVNGSFSSNSVPIPSDPHHKKFSFFLRLRRMILSAYQRLKRILVGRVKRLGNQTDSEAINSTINNKESPAWMVHDQEEIVKSTNVHDTMACDRARWAVAAPNVDLSGNWELLITEDFKQQYDTYLKKLDQPAIVRSVALSIVGMTTEETRQLDQGRKLYIRGRNARGVWERTLQTCQDTASTTKTTSSVNNNNHPLLYVPTTHTIITADDETVEAESWWEQQGTRHRSWLRGVKKYGGGSFESLRYLEHSNNHDHNLHATVSKGQVLVCVSTFHPDDTTKETATVTWRFKQRAS